MCDHVYVGACPHTCKHQRRTPSAFCASLPSFSHDNFDSELGSRMTARSLRGPPVLLTHREGWTGTPPHPALSIGARIFTLDYEVLLHTELSLHPYIDNFMVYVRRHQDGSVGKVWQLETSPREPQMGWESRLLPTLFSPSSGFCSICVHTHTQINVVYKQYVYTNMSKISVLKTNPENWLSRCRYSPCESDGLTTAPGAHVR